MRRARTGQSADTALHQARKAAKRARYASEAMSPAIGNKARRFVEQMKKAQSVLGDHQDAVIARRVDRELGLHAHLAGENALSPDRQRGSRQLRQPGRPSGRQERIL